MRGWVSRITGWALCAVALGGAGSSCRRSEAGPPKAVPVAEDGVLDLRVMSFNIRYENPGDPGSRAWRQRIAGAVRMIREEKPDVIGLQEALHGQAADLRASLPDYGFYGIGRDDGGRQGEYSAILYQKDRFVPDPADSGTFWLSATPEVPGSRTWGNEIPRVATWVRFDDRATGRGFYVFNTHWDHRSQSSRVESGALISRRIAERKRPDQPVVLLGDFNAVSGNPAVASLLESGLEDVWARFRPGARDSTTLHFWEGSRAGRRKVDHIFVSGGAEISDADIRDGDDPMVSDHFPVTARVRFR